jgi:hypothetical protein
MRRPQISGSNPYQQKPEKGGWRLPVGVHTFLYLFPVPNLRVSARSSGCSLPTAPAERLRSRSESFGYITAKSDWFLAHLYEFFEVFACSSIGFAITTYLPRVNVPQRARNL